MGGGGLEPPNPEGADLQSAAIATMRTSQNSFSIFQSSFEPIEGFEPTTPRLQITCSGQLSYIGVFLIAIERDCKDRYYFLFCNHFLKNIFDGVCYAFRINAAEGPLGLLCILLYELVRNAQAVKGSVDIVTLHQFCHCAH